MALTVALTLKWILVNRGLEAWLTRKSEHDPAPLNTRVARAVNQGCTHYVALHMNAGPAWATGTETFYRNAKDQAWAQLVHQSALAAFGLRDRGIKLEAQSQHPRLAVLDFPGPVCLLEMGFITNPLLDRPRFTHEPEARVRRIRFGEALAQKLGGL